MTSINGVNLVVPCINAKEIRLIKASQNSGSILEWRINLSHIFLHQKCRPQHEKPFKPRLDKYVLKIIHHI